VATGFGAAVGISLKVEVELRLGKGSGVVFSKGSDNKMTRKIIKDLLPNIHKRKLLTVKIKSDIPQGFGLKSSSAVSNALALACTGLMKKDIGDQKILDTAINASLYSKTTITGAYDDSTACYYGGFVVTNNYKRKILRQEKAQNNLFAIIFLPNDSSRGNLSELKILSNLYYEAYKLASMGEYWNAMTLNGLITSSILSNNYTPVKHCLLSGALAAGMSGNGPAITAVSDAKQVRKVQRALSDLEGNTLVSPLNNVKAKLVKTID
jgi:shikimate kinase